MWLYFVVFAVTGQVLNVQGQNFYWRDGDSRLSSPHLYQVMRVYSEPGQMGWGKTFNAYIRDLYRSPAGNWDNAIQSVCVWGVWLFFSRKDFNEDGYGSVEWGYGENYCFNLDSRLTRGIVSSMKYVGDIENWHESSITFYQHRLFMGTQYFTKDGTRDTVAWDEPKSLIINGRDSWTLYALEGFDGRCICLEPDLSIPLGLIGDLETSTGMSRVGSVRRGACRAGCVLFKTMLDTDSYYDDYRRHGGGRIWKY